MRAKSPLRFRAAGVYSIKGLNAAEGSVTMLRGLGFGV